MRGSQVQNEYRLALNPMATAAARNRTIVCNGVFDSLG